MAFDQSHQRLIVEFIDDPLTQAQVVANVRARHAIAQRLLSPACPARAPRSSPKAKDVHDPLSRWRLKRFRAVLEGMEGNDRIEVTGETPCETVMLAMSALESR